MRKGVARVLNPENWVTESHGGVKGEEGIPGVVGLFLAFKSPTD